MDILPDRLKIQSLNVRGLRQEKKRFDFFDSFKKQKLDIILVQESHWTPDDIPLLSKEWNVSFHCSGTTTNARGVSIIINNFFEHTVKDIITDKDGRFLLVNIELPDLCGFSLINVYGPNIDDANWLISVINKLDASLLDNQIWMGDWNTPLEVIDTYNYQFIRHKNLNALIKNMISSKDLIDIWREQNPSILRFTWGSKKPFKRARLDYCLISQGIMGLCPKADIKSPYKSDHSPIEITLNISKQPRGKGQWKFNNKLLEQNEYLDLIRNEINLAKATYALPIYDPLYVEKNKGTDLELNI